MTITASEGKIHTFERRGRQAEIAEYLEAMLPDGDERAVPVALRTVADAVGGMTELAEKLGSPARRCIGRSPREVIPGLIR
jgi:DNA-binding phage protein